MTATDTTGIAIARYRDVERARKRIAASTIDPETGCWNWQGATTVGYGRIKFGKRLALAHRVSYEIHVGPIPAGLHLDHLCRNRQCVNPDHLEAVTQRENNLRGVGAPAVNAKKTHCHRGHDLALARVTGGRRECRFCCAINKAIREGRPLSTIRLDIGDVSALAAQAVAA
jgi:hypothetical protein